MCGDLSMNDFTFLTNEQIFGKNCLDIFKKYGTKCAVTDFSILLGGFISSDFYTKEGKTRKDRSSWWWTKTPDSHGAVYIVDRDGEKFSPSVEMRNIGARPALPYSSIKAICSNEFINAKGIKEIEYGEYPQTIVDENYSRNLEMAYKNGTLKKTGKQYTTDDEFSILAVDNFKPRTHIEYEYRGNKYIRLIGGNANKCLQVLSDGQIVHLGNPYWVLVEPITWLVSENSNIVLSKKILFSGIQFKNKGYYDGDFERTDIKQFLNNYFSKEIVPSRVYQPNTLVDNKESLRKQNPYDFNFSFVSEEDIIKGAIESNIAVFLHGRPSEGKSARVKQLDPDCGIIYMRNETPDSFNGKSVYNAATGDMKDMPPTWYLKVKARCEAEPNKIHIIFFDELTNALPSIQGMAFNIVLDGEVNGKWKLPPNARIVAAGNDLNDSIVAYQMPEPLFNRFAHVYINTTVDSWLKWATTKKEKAERLAYKEEELEFKIHPAIIAYISYKSYIGHDVLRTKYTGDKPNADPRKWEMASKVLYKTKQPEMLRALIGEALTKDFIAFTKQQVISVEDVIKHNYSARDLEMNVSQKFATAVGLSSVDYLNFEVVRNFMKQLGAEPRAAFESIWAHGDERRLEKIAELKIADSLSEGEFRK